MENKNGQGIFYGVIGVATLVVAIIGATFAYFSASQTAGEGVINGSTNDNLASGLSLGVQRVTYSYTGNGESAPASDNLVPAVLTLTGTNDTTSLNSALTKKCVDDGYTGCHVYDITVSSAQTVATANLTFNLTTNATDKQNWKYLVFQGTTTSATAITKEPTLFTAASPNNEMAISGGLTSTQAHYYLLVYLENVDHSQNADASENNATSETGTYSGTVSLQAAGGQVKASFTA